jgi:hypothetical protein
MATHYDQEEATSGDPMVELLESKSAMLETQADLENGAGPPFSVLERLKARRSELAGERTFDLEVPGTGGLLVLRLGVMPRQRLAALTTRAAKTNGSEGDLNLNSDTLISACRSVLVREHRDDELRPVEPEAAQPVRIDERLGARLGLPQATRARDVLQAVFGMAPSPDLAIGAAAGQYMQWASAADADVDEEFVGESQAAPT